MTSVAEYHQAVKARLITDPLIVRFEIRREHRSVDDGHLRACLILRNGDQLEFSEYVGTHTVGLRSSPIASIGLIRVVG